MFLVYIAPPHHLQYNTNPSVSRIIGHSNIAVLHDQNEEIMIIIIRDVEYNGTKKSYIM